MPLRTPPPEQLDIPLVWEERERQQGRVPDDPKPGGHVLPPLAGAWWLWVGVLADTGVVVLAVAAGIGVAAALGAEIGPGQLVLAGLAGLEVATVVALGSLWGWRATPGMLLVRLCFSQPLPWGRVFRLWLCWVLSMLVAGVPLLLRRRGESVAERLAGGSLSFRSPAEGA
jgi:hypothetical protein